MGKKTAWAVTAAWFVGSILQAAEYPLPQSRLYLDSNLEDLIVARVLRTSAHPPTNGKPPVVELEVEEVLRGDRKADRRVAVFEPEWRPLGSTREWRREPFEAVPKLGQRLLLSGRFFSHDAASRFHIFTNDAMLLSSIGRAMAQDQIRREAFQEQGNRKRAEAEYRKWLDAVSQWCSQVGPGDISRYFREADFVVCGECTHAATGNKAVRFKVAQILKGKRRNLLEVLDGVQGAPEPELWMRLPAEKWHLLSFDPQHKYLLFLSEEALYLDRRRAEYLPIRHGDGFVLANEESLCVVRDAAREMQPLSIRPVLIVGFSRGMGLLANEIRQTAGRIRKAAESKFLVADSGDFTRDYFLVEPADRDNYIPPGGDALVMILPMGRRDSVSIIEITAARLSQNKIQVVLQECCDSNDAETQKKLSTEAIRRLLDPKLFVSRK